MQKYPHNLIIPLIGDKNAFNTVKNLNNNHSLKEGKVVFCPLTKLALLSDDLDTYNIPGCVLLLSKNIISHPEFEGFIDRCNSIILKRAYFRLFVFIVDLSDDEIEEFKKEIKWFADLYDNVQIPSIKDYSDSNIAFALNYHIEELPDIYESMGYHFYKKIAGKVITFLNISAFFGTIGVILFWAIQEENGLYNPFFNWISLAHGFILYWVFFVLLTTKTSININLIFRLIFITSFPIWLFKNIPLEKLFESVNYILAGFLSAFLISQLTRYWVSFRRRNIPLDYSKDYLEFAFSQWKGNRPWNHLTNAPIFGLPPKVFISYSRSSSWGRRVALEIKDNLDKLKIPSFLDVKNVPIGCSWRQHLHNVLGRATVVVVLQDSETSSKKWPTTELAYACNSQRYSGVPSIVLVRDEEFKEPVNNCAINKVLFPDRAIPQTSLFQIINYTPGCETQIAAGLAYYQTKISLLPTFSGAIINLLTNFVILIFSQVGWVAGLLGFPSLIFSTILYFSDFSLINWILELNLQFFTSLSLAYMVGFIFILFFSFLYEFKDQRAKAMIGNLNLSIFFMMLLLYNLLPSLSPLQILYIFLSFLFGGLIALYYIPMLNYGSKDRSGESLIKDDFDYVY